MENIVEEAEKKNVKARELTCIGCPVGCMMTIELEEGAVIKVLGNTCQRGEVYARKEVTNPTRIVTSTIRVLEGMLPVVSVKTKEDIPKEKIMDCMMEINATIATAPIRIGDILIENVAGTKVAVVATKNVKAIF